MDYKTVDTEFLRPIVTGWLNKIESASRSRQSWKEVADECSMFYSNSAKAMWDPHISKKFWSNVKLPKFRVTINKAFEMVAIFGPHLLWDVPHRNVESKRPLNLPPELLLADPNLAPLAEQLMQQQAQSESKDQIISHLMGRWLNYTPREQPGGGLSGHSFQAVTNSLIKGRGVCAAKPYQMPGSGRTLTGCFHVRPEDVYLDPDYNSVDECRWMAIKHVDPYQDVERRFKLPKNSLKKKAQLESSWNYGELSTVEDGGSERAAGITNDLLVWYEVFSKSGVGCYNTTLDPALRDHLEDTVGQYAYIAICPDCPYPLNMSTEEFRKGATDEEVADNFSWPVPFWADDRWPVEFLDYYMDPGSAWPVAPLAPGLGELKLLNFLFSWFANRTWKSSRDFWAVAQPHLEHYRQYIENGDDQSIIPTPVGIKTPKEAVEILTQPESRHDMTQLIAFVSDMFDKRVGLTPTIYGQNEGGTQNRTAEETSAKNRAVQARPEYMQKRVVDWQSRLAQAEAFVTRWFVGAEDVLPLMGPAGSILWQQSVMSSDIEAVVRQFSYTVAASSIRRPNRDRDLANFQLAMAQFAPVYASHGQQSGDYAAFNGLVEEWGKLNDMKTENMTLPEPEPPTPEEEAQQEALQQQAQQLELAEKQATVQKLQAEAQAKMIDSQVKQAQLQLEAQEAETEMQKAALQVQADQAREQIKQQSEQQKLQLDLLAKQFEIQSKQVDHQIEMNSKLEEHELELAQDEATHLQELAQDEEMHQQELRQRKAEQREQARNQSENRPVSGE